MKLATATTGSGLYAIEAISYSKEDVDPPPAPVERDDITPVNSAHLNSALHGPPSWFLVCSMYFIHFGFWVLPYTFNTTVVR